MDRHRSTRKRQAVWRTESSTTEKMHPRNKYLNNPPDFARLGRLYPPLAPFVIFLDDGSFAIDFSNPKATRELTRALLHHDFQLNWDMPIDQLCPPVPNRLNYIHWIEDLLSSPSASSSASSASSSSSPPGSIKGIDIGTGASCIYPLLGVRVANHWSFLATDIDPISLDFAQKNIETNDLNSKIELRLVEDPSTILIGVLKEADGQFDFCMCNPPFFDESETVVEKPGQECNATHGERFTAGGEEAFVGRIIQDSFILRKRIRWYSSMLGKKSSFLKLKKVLEEKKEEHCLEIRTTEFIQGKTMRWGLAWTFCEPGVPNEDETKEDEAEEGDKRDAKIVKVEQNK